MLEREGSLEFAGGMELDELREACGVFGVFDPSGEVGDLRQVVLMSALAQQHRGQDSAGLSVVIDGEIRTFAQPGLVDALDRTGIADLGEGATIASSHVRYGTARSDNAEGFVQPIVIGNDERTFGTIAHNGHLQSEVLQLAGSEYVDNTTDTERIAELLRQSASEHGSLIPAINEVLPKIKDGAFSFVLTTPNELIAVRDPYGFRPLVMGERRTSEGVAYAFASETVGLEPYGFQYVRDVEPGEMVIVDESGDRSTFPFGHKSIEQRHLCSLEHIYFSDPTSEIDGVPVQVYRRELGKALARQDLERYGDNFADVVFGVPDSGLPAAYGYAEELGLPIVMGVSRNRYKGRTFIEGTQAERVAAVAQKHKGLRGDLSGRRVVGIDDSWIRGTTGAGIVRTARAAGASEIHMRSTAPMYIASCFMGIETGDREQLMAHKFNSDLEAMRRATSETAGTQLTSLDFLDLDTMVDILDRGKRDPSYAVGSIATGICTSCFTGEYPIDIYKYMDPEEVPVELRR